MKREIELDPYSNPYTLNINILCPTSSPMITQVAKQIDLTTTKNKIHLRMVLANLQKHYPQWTSYSRDHNYPTNLGRYNPSSITSHILLKTIDSLYDHGLIEKAAHRFRGRNDPTNRISRMRATPNLINLFNAHPSTINHSPLEELLILKDADKKIIDYQDNKRTSTMRGTIKKYNALLETTNITLSSNANDHDLGLTNKRVVRIFNNGSWSQGGRFYGGFWQQTPSHLRKHILINQNPTVELDYQALHVRLLYAKEGLNYPRNLDPYHIPQYINQGHPLTRNFLKKTLLMAFNCKSLRSLRATMTNEIKKEPSKYPPTHDQPPLSDVMEIFKTIHAPIAHYIYKGIGLTIQYLDSQIAENIIKEMTKKNLPILSIHDSFICKESDEEALTNSMREAFIHLFRTGFPQVEPLVVTRKGQFRGITTALEGQAYWVT